MTETIGIAGSGAIATGTAATAAAHGQDVVLWARSDDSAERARGVVEKHAGKLEFPAERVEIVTAMGGLDRCSIVVEAVAEDPTTKAVVLGELVGHVGPETLLGTTTSSLSIETLARATGAPERFVGLHVFNPVPRMKLVELAFPAAASSSTRERASALCETWGKVAVEVPDTAGFVVNRLLFPYLFDAVRFMEESGLEATAIDTAMNLGAGHPMGPLALLDFVGLDVSAAIGETIGVEVPRTVRDLIAQGRLGRKTKGGLLSYE